MRANMPTAGFKETEGEGTNSNWTPTQLFQTIENMRYTTTEPISVRFARNETKGLQRPDLAPCSSLRGSVGNRKHFGNIGVAGGAEPALRVCYSLAGGGGETGDELSWRGVA
jgi:hypothetical protein